MGTKRTTQELRPFVVTAVFVRQMTVLALDTESAQEAAEELGIMHTEDATLNPLNWVAFEPTLKETPKLRRRTS